MMDIQTLLDERDITQRLGLFARIVDRRTWDNICDVFADNLEFNYGDGVERKGIGALRDMFSTFLDRCGPTQHLLGSLLVDVKGDTAISQCYVLARHQGIETRTDRFIDFNGEYVDQWRRQGNGWRIVRRDTRPILFQGDISVLYPRDCR